MEITRQNIDHYLALYMDGRLDPVKSAALMSFLADNPDIEQALMGDSALKLFPDKIEYPDKQKITKDFSDVGDINARNFDEFCIARLENLLDSAEQKKLADYIKKHPEVQKDARIYSMLKLSPQLVKYTGKEKLKKQDHTIIHNPLSDEVKSKTPVSGRRTFYPGRKALYYSLAAAAALVFLLMLLYPGFQTPEEFHPLATTNYEEGQTDENRASEPNSFSQPQSTASVPVPGSSPDLRPIAPDLPSQAMPVIDPADLQHPATMKISFSRLDPLTPSAFPASVKVKPEINTAMLAQGTGSRVENTLPDERGILERLLELDAWETTQMAVKGIKLLTESNMSVDKVTDENGYTRIIIDTEDGTQLSTRLGKQAL